jgi:hypothetical protein
MKRKAARKAPRKAKKAAPKAAKKASPRKKAAPKKAAAPKAPAPAPALTSYTPPSTSSFGAGSSTESGWSSDFEGEEE